MSFALMAAGILALGAALLLASGIASVLWVLIACVLIVGGLLLAVLQGIKEQIAVAMPTADDAVPAPRQVSPKAP